VVFFSQAGSRTVRKRNTRIMYDRPTAYGWSVGISTQRPVDSEMSGEIGKIMKDPHTAKADDLQRHLPFSSRMQKLLFSISTGVVDVVDVVITEKVIHLGYDSTPIWAHCAQRFQLMGCRWSVCLLLHVLSWPYLVLVRTMSSTLLYGVPTS